VADVKARLNQVGEEARLMELSKAFLYDEGSFDELWDFMMRGEGTTSHVPQVQDNEVGETSALPSTEAGTQFIELPAILPLHGQGPCLQVHGQGPCLPVHGQGPCLPVQGQGPCPPLHVQGLRLPLQGQGPCPPLQLQEASPPLQGQGPCPALQVQEPCQPLQAQERALQCTFKERARQRVSSARLWQ